MKTGKPEVLANMNRNAILKLLRKEGPLSRAQISRRLNVSFPTVSSNVKMLIKSGLVKEVGKGDNDLGRKSTLLAFNADKGYVIGIDIGRSQIRGMTSNLLGKVLNSVEKDCPVQKGGPHILQQVLGLISDLIEPMTQDNIMCICIGIPGIRDEEREKNWLAPFIKSWQDINIKKVIKEEFQTKVIIDNSVNFGAIGEKWQGVAQGYKDIVYINYGVGIGAGIILNGELYRGFNNTAGEVGYMTLNKHYIRNRFEEEGSLEELISGVAIKEKMDKLDNEKEEFTVKKIFELAKENNRIAKNIVEESVIYTAMTLVNIVSVINPEIIVMSGGIGRVICKRYNFEILDILNSHIPYVPELVVSELGVKANVLGAIGVGIRYAKNNIL